ncbi:chloride channel protein [Amylibacter marinus]|uniref:Chloride channel protein n=1 Tax=Amylibacter marinus TaxID=1475483 RepID=A0ABQ5VTT8_9RHOB|nr:chloride channel protein [Amylibacter marinus]GLQ34857.1 chloride channel protein [Amylibacter marinus]
MPTSSPNKTLQATLQDLHRCSLVQVRFWVIALLIGIAAGFATIGFRVAISELQSLFYGADDLLLASTARDLPWHIILCLPILGGALVGVILQYFTHDGRTRSVAHVIEGAALHDGRVEGRAGLASVLASLITLSTGGSAGREGPVVHLGAVISSKISRLMKADAITARDLMGCAAASAVAASFNAPLAGAVFAMEVVLRHYAIHALAPIMIASVSGAVISRLYFGNVTEFTLPGHVADFYLELPAHLLLGIISALVAVSLIKSVFWAEDFADKVQAKTGLPQWARPTIAGALLGVIAIFFPHIIGVGYETTSHALTGNLALGGAVLFAFIKALAVVITLAGRMGGGIFSPALMLGALTGLAFGWVAVALFPSVNGDETLYALAGMGAVAAAVLGAPLSTTLIVFELTEDWQAGLAVMVAVSVASAITGRFVHRSFFISQLERRGVHLADGDTGYILSKHPITDVMRPAEMLKVNRRKKLWKMVAKGLYLDGSATLEQAMPLFETGYHKALPVVQLGGESDAPVLLGAVYHVDALKTYNAALNATAIEEHS